MMRSFLLLATVGLFAADLSAGNGHGHPPSSAGAIPAVPAQRQEFLENKGHLPSQVLYRADFGTLALFAERDRFTWSMLQPDAGERVHQYQHDKLPFDLRGHAWQMKLVGASPSLSVNAEDRSSASYNFFMGNDPAKWSTNAHAFGEVHYDDVWPGIDLVLKISEGAFKYDVLLESGADVKQVKFDYDGLESLGLDEEGRLKLATTVGELFEMSPVAWYADGAKEKVDCRFVVDGNTVGFHLGTDVDTHRPIVIDPLLIASTLSGTGNIGTTENYGHTATYDAAGNIYTGAICFGQGYPATPGAFDLTYAFGGINGLDIAISKLNTDGSNLLWATYIGGDQDDYPHSLVVTPAGELAILGSSESSDYPTTAGAFDATPNGGADIVVTKLDPTGSFLVGSTYVGGVFDDGRNFLTTNYGDVYRGEIITDATGNIHVACGTASPTFPTSPGAYQAAPAGGLDGVVFSLNTNLSTMLWGTCLGTAADDYAFGLRLDGAGGVFVCGGTTGANFPTTAGAYQTVLGGAMDGFVVRLTGNGSVLDRSTLFGGAVGNDNAFFVDLDLGGDVYIYGQTSGGIAITPGGTYGVANAEVFVAQFDPTLSTTIFTTTIGNGSGSVGLTPIAFLVDECDHVYISGHDGLLGGTSAGYPLTANALQPSGGFYLAAFDVDMTGLLFGTYYGAFDDHVDGGTSRFDPAGIVYQAVCTSGPFPTTGTAYSSVQPFGWDIGVFKIDFQVAGVHAAGGSNVNTGCAPISIDFINTSTGTNWTWDFGDGSPVSNLFEPSYTYTAAGSYTVTLIASDPLSCNLADTVTFQINIGLGLPLDAQFTWAIGPDCTVPQVATTNNSTGSPISFIWDMGDGTQYTDTNVIHTYAAPGFYFVELYVYDPSGCSPPDSLTTLVNIPAPLAVIADFTYTTTPDCSGLYVSTTNLSTGPSPSYEWDMGDGIVYVGTQVFMHLYDDPGTYNLTLIAYDAFACNVTDTISVVIQVDSLQPIDASFTVAVSPSCTLFEATTTNTTVGTNLLFNWDMGDGTLYADTNVVHTYALAGTYTIQLIVSDSMGCVPQDTVTAQVIFAPSVPVVADFTVAQVVDCSTNSVQTTNLSTGTNMAFAWDMGDGTTYGNFPDVLHNYLTQGTYDIQLIVIDLNGCVPNDTMVVPINIAPPLLVDAAFSITQDPDCNELRVDCINTSTGPAPGYQWDMGDGTTYTSMDVVDHIYGAPGTYTITLIATDTLACNLADTVSIDVTLLPYAPVVAAFTSVQVFDCLQALLDATNTSTGSFMSFLWDMGDGTQYTDTNVTHSYLSPGTFDITLVVTDLAGCTAPDTASFQVTVDPLIPVVAAFTTDQVGNCSLLTVQGINQSTGDSIAFTWDMGDGTTYTTTDVTHVYTTPGTYTIELVVQDLGCGNDDSVSTTITVIDALPVVAATTGVICPGLTTDITATYTPGSTYLWNDGSTGSVLTVAVAGTYFVTVTFDNCTGSDTVDVVAAPDQELSYGFDACPGTAITLTVPFQGAAYLWESGGTEQSEYTIYPGTDTTDYAFQIWDSYGCVFEDTVTVTPMDGEPQLFAPNAFTPDGDGLNDEFVITGYGEQDVELLIFNRWGEQIFNSTSLSDTWNGTYNGLIKQDVYVYKLKYNGECTNDETSIIGHVTVLK